MGLSESYLMQGFVPALKILNGKPSVVIGKAQERKTSLFFTDHASQMTDHDFRPFHLIDGVGSWGNASYELP